MAIAEGGTLAGDARRIGMIEQTFNRWRSEYGGLRIDQASRPTGQESSGPLGWGFTQRLGQHRPVLPQDTGSQSQENGFGLLGRAAGPTPRG